MTLAVIKAKKVLEKSPYYSFFKENFYNFKSINDDEIFEHLDKYYDLEIYDSSFKPHFNLDYICWFVMVCVFENYGDDSYEFENDLDTFIYNYEYIKTHKLSKVFCEIKEFLLAYKILCSDSCYARSIWGENSVKQGGFRFSIDDKDINPIWYEHIPKNLEF